MGASKDTRQKVPQGLTDQQIAFLFVEANRLAQQFGKAIRWEDPNEHS